MTIADDLLLLAETKEAIRRKLLLSKNIAFSDYASYIPGFSTDVLFEDNKPGLIYDISVTGSMWQDAAMTIPVTQSGDPVGAVVDLSGNGNHALQAISTARPTYITDGNYHRLYFDGVDDHLLFTVANRTDDMYVGIVHEINRSGSFGLICSVTSNYRIFWLGFNDSIFFPDALNKWVLSVNKTVVSKSGKRIGGYYVSGLSFNKKTVMELDNANLNQSYFAALKLGALGSNIDFFKGTIESLVISAKPSDENRRKITEYLAQKSGVTL